MKTLIVNKINASLLTLAVVASLMFVGGSARAQEGAPSMEMGPYVFNMGLMAGYRNAIIYGQGADAANGSALITDFWAQERYYEAMNYRKGLNVNSFNIYGEKKGSEGFFDEFYLNVDGIGDPYTTAALRMRAFNQFDLKVDFRDMKYFVDRNDSIYTALRKNDESRQFLNASLGYDVSDNLNLKLGYYSTGHTGDYTTTWAPFIEGGEEIIIDPVKKTVDGSFGTYARGNFYFLNAPKNDKTSEFSLQATLKMDNASATLGGGMRSYTQDYKPTLVNDTSLTYYSALNVPNWAGIVGNFPNSAAKSLNNPLTFYNYDDNQKSSTPFAFLEAVVKPADAVSITANFRWEDTKLDGTISANQLGLMSRAGTVPPGGVATRFVTDTMSAVQTNKLGSIMASLTVAANLTDQLSLTALYRMTSTHLESDGLLTSSVGATDSAQGTDLPGSLVFKSKFHDREEHVVVDNKTTINFIEAFANWAPMNTLNVRAGVMISMRTPVYTRTAEDAADSGSNAFLSRDSKSLTPFASFWYRPWKGVKVSGRFSHADTKFYASGTSNQMDAPIRIDPEKVDKYSATLELQPTDDLRATMRFQGMKGSSAFLDMIAAVEPSNPMLNTGMTSLSATINYNMSKKTILSLSGEYRRNDFSVPFTWTRGQNLPVALRIFGDSLTVAADQHTKDIYLDASMTLNPVEPVHLLFGASMINSVGSTYLTPEVQVATAQPDLERQGGPYSYYVAHAQVGYDITKNIGVQADYQYVALQEQKIASFTGIQNNFNASLFRGSVYVKL